MHLKKHLQGKKSPIHLFVFLCFLCAFLGVKQRRQYFYVHKKHLRSRKSPIQHFVLFYGFCAFYVHKKHLSESCLFVICAFCTSKIFS